ncbi:poly(rC)-binding protein 3-like isoform X1 [Patiria miniata]|uniref:K Homology domain-containing protein n=1 Tax=Patiria miniata TaxID=46514 RepID=A0A914BPU8_PATMI|nr:poly(rC)-binding protein 3-like isoform X1 [Patiria miniata]XP_038077979.1 poly(rC)-binding protein 3-like isoform X1 [Patiria miniata]XP_038077980.1 poly(rC)-binding protein 3-like isoform X1 [Patiria miniata]XP_038077981.1 poly(rC)-binding protein 3-like isoform X1 [Patiria miniata]
MTSPEDTSGMVGNSDTPSVTLTIRLIMQGKEVGSIIGKNGETVKKFRAESQARINISDCSCQERIVTISGSPESINVAFSLITNKFELDLSTNPNNNTPSGAPKPPVTLRLIVPASQCGSLIGKAGAKIKDIRETTGASIQVASEMLPNSTERAVTISGTPEAITKAVHHVCRVMLESPPKGATIPYRPKQHSTSIIFAGGQAYAVHGNYAVPQPDVGNQLSKLQYAMQHTTTPFIPGQSHFPAGAIQQYSAAAANTVPVAPTNQQTHEITIPNSVIGCVIGRQGSKIQEIRQLSGANIKINDVKEGSPDRVVTITGQTDSIAFAQYLINFSLETAKSQTSVTVDPSVTSMTSFTTSSSPTTLTPNSAPSPTISQDMTPLSNILMKPVPLLSLDALQQASNAYTTKIRTATVAAVAGAKKFSPY